MFFFGLRILINSRVPAEQTVYGWSRRERFVPTASKGTCSHPSTLHARIRESDLAGNVFPRSNPLNTAVLCYFRRAYTACVIHESWPLKSTESASLKPQRFFYWTAPNFSMRALGYVVARDIAVPLGCHAVFGRLGFCVLLETSPCDTMIWPLKPMGCITMAGPWTIPNAATS